MFYVFYSLLSTIDDCEDIFIYNSFISAFRRYISASSYLYTSLLASGLLDSSVNDIAIGSEC